MFRRKMRMLVTEGMRRLIRKTPVNTGQAVASYVASAGTPTSRVANRPEPVEATNRLALGQEKLRGQAEAAALATLSGINYDDPFQSFYITNAAPHIGGLEHGSLPGAPYTPRSPGGMFGVTVQELLALLSSGSF